MAKDILFTKLLLFSQSFTDPRKLHDTVHVGYEWWGAITLFYCPWCDRCLSR